MKIVVIGRKRAHRVEGRQEASWART